MGLSSWIGPVGYKHLFYWFVIFLKMLVEVTFSSVEDLEDQQAFIQRVLGVPIVDRRDNVLIVETTPEIDLDEIRALRGVTSVEVVR